MHSLKKFSYIISLAVCCTAIFVYLSPPKLNENVAPAVSKKDTQVLEIYANNTHDDYEHEAVTVNILPSAKLTSRNETRNNLRFIKDKSFSTENFSTKQFVRTYGIQIVFYHTPQNLGLTMLQRLNI